MSKKELDFADVRQICASIAAKEELRVVIVKSRKYSVISLPAQRKKSNTTPVNIDPQDVKTLEHILLDELNIKGRDKLMTRMASLMRSLKTTDLRTAQSFLGLDRYSEVRQNIVQQLHEFVANDLKMTIANRKIEDN